MVTHDFWVIIKIMKMVWPTTCAALKGRFFEILKIHCKGVLLTKCTARVYFWRKKKSKIQFPYVILINFDLQHIDGAISKSNALKTFESNSNALIMLQCKGRKFSLKCTVRVPFSLILSCTVRVRFWKLNFGRHMPSFMIRVPPRESPT